MSRVNNNGVLIGNISTDLELKTYKNDLSVCNFNLAVDRPRRKDQDRKTDFFPMTAFRQTADFICKYLQKGDRIGVTYHLAMSEYTDENDKTQRRINIEIDEVMSLPRNRTDAQSAGSEDVPSTAPTSTDDDDEELPF